MLQGMKYQTARRCDMVSKTQHEASSLQLDEGFITELSIGCVDFRSTIYSTSQSLRSANKLNIRKNELVSANIYADFIFHRIGVIYVHACHPKRAARSTDSDY